MTTSKTNIEIIAQATEVLGNLVSEISETKYLPISGKLNIG